MRRVLALLVLAAGCAADGPPRLELGTTARGPLGPHDEQVGDGTLVDRYTMTAPAGERVVVTAAAEGYEAFLAVQNPTGEMGGAPQGVGAPACIAVEARASRPLSVAVSSAYALAMGPYVLETQVGGAISAGCRIVRP